MRLSIVISTNDAETTWNAFRLANFSLDKGDEVAVFIIGKGVEYVSSSTKTFNTLEQAETLLKHGGKIFACGTCMRSRGQSASDICPVSTLKDLYELIAKSDKVITF